MPNDNQALKRAKDAKMDEFYTKYEDIDREVSHYIPYLEDKIIYCNADNQKSNFYKYFNDHFKDYKLKKLICTALDGFCSIRDQDSEWVIPNGGGGYESENCKKYLDEADVVITNPPFSQANAYLVYLLENNKDVLIMVNLPLLTNKKIFPYFVEKRIRCGYNRNGHYFYLPDNSIARVGNICWVTSFPTAKESINNNIKFKDKEYEYFDNYPDIVNINKVNEIPNDYNEVMGVPSSILTKINNDQFEILGQLHSVKDLDYYDWGRAKVNGKEKFTRVLIKRLTKE